MTNIEKKSSLITEFVLESSKDEEYEDFFKLNDIGIPLAVSISNKLIEKLTPEGNSLIEETWVYLCTVLDIDPNDDYNGIEEMIDFDEDDDDEEDDE
jgi:hypothetical protein